MNLYESEFVKLKESPQVYMSEAAQSLLRPQKK